MADHPYPPFSGDDAEPDDAIEAVTDDLASYLLARLNEDAEVARTAAVGSAEWRLNDIDDAVLWWPPEPPEHVERTRAYPCPTLRLLAQPYATHDDFRDEWRL